MTIEELTSLYAHIDALKKLRRAGWARQEVSNPESVAEHSFGTAILAAKFAEYFGLDAAKAALMAALHDIGESIVGDITPHDNIEKPTKFKKESAAVKDILGSESLYEVWLDFELARTPEGRLVYQLDKLEAYLQARAYKLPKQANQEFLESTKAALYDKELTDLLNGLEKTDQDQA